MTPAITAAIVISPYNVTPHLLLLFKQWIYSHVFVYLCVCEIHLVFAYMQII